METGNRAKREEYHLWLHRHPSPSVVANAVTMASPGREGHRVLTVGTISLGYDDTGKRLRRFVRGKTKQEVKGKLNDLHEEIKAGIYTPATYTVRQCVMDWLDSLEFDPHTMATYRGQAEKWIYPKIRRQEAG